MIAEIKHNLVAKFDKAIEEAKEKECKVIVFHLESEEENASIRKYAAGAPMFFTSPGDELFDDLDYLGIPVMQFKSHYPQPVV